MLIAYLHERANTRALLAALFALLTAHTRDVSESGIADLPSIMNDSGFAVALQRLESAAEQAEDAALASSVRYLRMMYLQVR